MKKLAIAVLTVACLGMALPAAAAKHGKGARHHHMGRHHHMMTCRTSCDPCNRCYSPRRYVSRCCVRVRHCCPVRKCYAVRTCCPGGGRFYSWW